jgi:uncharacterized protein (DUF1778 family)
MSVEERISMSRSATLKEPTTAGAQRRERLEARLSPEQKALLERAAALEGRSLTDFVVSSAQSAALETIQRYEVIELTAEDSLAFAKALMNPSPPNEALRAAARRHRELVTE